MQSEELRFSINMERSNNIKMVLREINCDDFNSVLEVGRDGILFLFEKP
jgi:hypothetical protein